MKITVDLANRQSVITAIDKWTKIIKSNYYLINTQKIVIEYVNQKVLLPNILKNKSLYFHISEIFADVQSDLIFILKLIEFDTEEEASDIAFECSKPLRQLTNKKWAKDSRIKRMDKSISIR